MKRFISISKFNELTNLEATIINLDGLSYFLNCCFQHHQGKSILR